MAKEAELNKALALKNKAERTVLEFNQQRVDRYAVRAQFYYHYDKFLHNKKQELKGNIRVFCRIRPILDSDLNQIPIGPTAATSAQINRLSVMPTYLPKLLINQGNPAGIKSKKRLEELKIPFAEKLVSSQ